MDPIIKFLNSVDDFIFGKLLPFSTGAQPEETQPIPLLIT
jgi:hypothetical protein